MITIKNLSKTYKTPSGETRALSNIDCTIPDGQWVSITGPSGSGKSTLANVIAGILAPDPGGHCRIVIEEDNLDLDVCMASDMQKSELRTGAIAFIHQDFNLISYLSVLENVVLPDILRKKKPDWDKARSILSALSIESKENNMPDELSGGQQQRVAIARALYSDARILMADEPTGNLDEISRDEIISIFKELHKNGMTMLVITHDHYLAGMAQRILHLEDGRLV